MTVLSKNKNSFIHFKCQIYNKNVILFCNSYRLLFTTVSCDGYYKHTKCDQFEKRLEE